MALGGVDMGSIKAQLAASVTGIQTFKGSSPIPRATPPTTGRKTATRATFDMISVRNNDTVVKARITDLTTNRGQKDLSKKAHTLLEYEGVRYNLKLPKSDFEERYLRRAPRKYLK